MTEEQAGELIALLGEITATVGTSGFPATEVIAGAAGVIAILAFLWSVYTYKVEQRESLLRRNEERTLNFINEFFSKDFTAHRSANWKTKKALAGNEITMEFVAKGFVVGIDEPSFEGDLVNGLTEHNHLGMLLYFLQRISFALSSQLVDQDALKATLGYQLRWHSDFLRDLIKECRGICVKTGNAEPAFCSSVEKVLHELCDDNPRHGKP